ncbi:hypothetical protein PENTCL1PPCAC_3836, partial [Pristionchus entomophagus]
MESIGVWIFPFLTSLFGLGAVLIPYSVAVRNGHVPAVIPFISDCGIFAPEKCFFSLFLNLTALFLAISVYLRHRQIVGFYGSQMRRRWRTISLSLMIMGVIAAFCTSAVGSFSARETMLGHAISAMGTFNLITIYIWGQVALSFVLEPRFVCLFH